MNHAGLLFVWVIAFLSVNCFADEEAFLSLDKHPRIHSIKIVGLKRTSENVVKRELSFKEGDTLTTNALLESLQELKSLQLFAYVRPFLELLPGNQVNLTLELQEKWTIIPYFSYSSGGGTEYLKAGIYDINLFGSYVETGAQYNRWNNEPGGYIWFRNPRFLNQHKTIAFAVGDTQQPRVLYDNDGNDMGNFVLRRKQWNLEFYTEVNNILKLGALFEYFADTIHSADQASFQDIDSYEQLSRYGDTKILLNSLNIEVGKIHYDIDVVKGKKTELLLSHSNTKFASDLSFNKFKWISQHYYSLPKRSYIASNFTLAATDSPLLQQHYYVGGFSHIRGYYDGQFRNRSYWQLNVEYRIPSYRSRWIILQHVFFIDAANSANRIYDLNNFESAIYSAGTGVRLISPRIYSFNGRLDVALYTSGKSQTILSLGTQHFF